MAQVQRRAGDVGVVLEGRGREHRGQQDWLRDFFDEQERRVADTDPQALELARKRVRDLARVGREMGANSRRDRGRSQDQKH